MESFECRVSGLAGDARVSITDKAGWMQNACQNLRRERILFHILLHGSPQSNIFTKHTELIKEANYKELMLAEQFTTPRVKIHNTYPNRQLLIKPDTPSIKASRREGREPLGDPHRSCSHRSFQ